MYDHLGFKVFIGGVSLVHLWFQSIKVRQNWILISKMDSLVSRK